MSVHPKNYQVAVLFIHGLGLPNQIDAVNRRFMQQLSAVMNTQTHSIHPAAKISQTHIATINYARLFEKKQLELWNMHGFSWFHLSTWLRVIPMRLLQLGLSFWGDVKVREVTMSSVCTEINKLAQKVSNTGEPYVFLLCGFSMGATICLELLHSLRLDENLRNKCLDEGGRSLLEHASSVVTIGCALNWHFPLRPFSRSTHSVPWLNIHYSTDVMASAIQDQDKQFSHVEDLELLPYYVNRSTLFAFIFYVLFNIFRPFRLIVDFLSVLVKSTPLSHLFYFYDPSVYQLLKQRIEMIIANNELHSALDVETAVVESPLISSIEDVYPVTLDKVYEKICVNSKKQRVYIYAHGMSTPRQIQQEIDCVQRQIASIEHDQTTTVVLLNVRYDNLVNKDKLIRYGRKMSFSDVRIYYKDIKQMVLGRFPIAMSIWTEPTVFESIVHELCQRLLEFSRDQSMDTEVILVGYTIGTIVLLKSVGEMQRNGKVECASEVFNQSPHVKLSSIITLGCPLPWFGPSEDFPLPNFSKNCSKGWINVFYSNDICSISLRKSNKTYENHVTNEWEIQNKQILPPFSEYLACLNGLYLRDGRVWGKFQGLIQT